MITEPTVLILGAGASAPFGFPVGRQMLIQICEHLRDSNTDLSQQMEKCGLQQMEMEF